MIDSNEPSIVAATNRLVTNAQSERERAVRIHDFVRDEIKFGWANGFYDQRASEVLNVRIGYCNTKSTLFVAMLRAAGIEARQRFMNIDAAIVRDFLDPGTSYVDHSYTEVKIEGRWLSVDSYVVDRPLANAARARLQREAKIVGYGVHRNGTTDWDGTKDAFSQFVNDGTYPNLTTKDFGVYADVNAFYASGNGVNTQPWVIRQLIGVFSRSANRRIANLRRG
ncbi:MAG: transglutaminase-like domain-containing protein [Casimicrobium sp.]